MGKTNNSGIKDVRKARGLTQEELATASGVSRVSIARYETGVCAPSTASAIKIAAALDCTLDELLKRAVVEM